jgi:hypothetical protein
MHNELSLAQWCNNATKEEREQLCVLAKISHSVLSKLRYAHVRPTAAISESVKAAAMKISGRRIYFEEVSEAERIFLYRPIKQVYDGFNSNAN